MKRLFPLHAVLQLRSREEEAEERAFSEANRAVQQTWDAIAHLDKVTREWNEGRARDIHRQTLAADLQTAATQGNQLRRQREQLLQHATSLQVKRAERQRAYLAARTARQTLTELHEKHEKAWSREQASREQTQLQEMIAARWRETTE